jgi:RNA polymerase sigma-70 factor, ECF subfamily
MAPFDALGGATAPRYAAMPPAPPPADRPPETAAPPIDDGAEASRRPAPDFREVFAENAPYVWRALRSLGVAEGDAEDVSQEVFLVVHRRLDDYDPRYALRTWLYGICLRAAAAYRRRPHVRREQAVAEVPDAACDAAQHEALERARLRAELDAALAGLDDDKRAAYVLHELEGLPVAEVARAMGCPLQTAYSRLVAARRHVEACFRRTHAPEVTP